MGVKRYKLVRVTEETWKALREICVELGYGATFDKAIQWLLEKVKKAK